MFQTQSFSYIFSRCRCFLQNVFQLGIPFNFTFLFTQRPEEKEGEIITSCCQNFPQLCQLLYIFIVNWMPPPSPSIEEICVFCHRTIWQKKQKPINSVLFPIFTTNREAALSLDLPRNNARILRPGVNRRNIDLWWKTELHHVNYIRQTQDCQKKETETN